METYLIQGYVDTNFASIGIGNVPKANNAQGVEIPPSSHEKIENTFCSLRTKSYSKFLSKEKPHKDGLR